MGYRPQAALLSAQMGDVSSVTAFAACLPVSPFPSLGDTGAQDTQKGGLQALGK